VVAFGTTGTRDPLQPRSSGSETAYRAQGTASRARIGNGNSQ